MLSDSEKILFIYVVDRDFGFAPNPFHGYCTLATCKPRIRKSAEVGDWIMGVGGRRLNATGKCVYLMQVTEITSFDEYWLNAKFMLKKPLRNGSLVMMVGDNIYHSDDFGSWVQEDSHHSNIDGSTNEKNLRTDTSSSKVLISSNFYYFGSSAPHIDLGSIGYNNGIGYRKYILDRTEVIALIQNIENSHHQVINTVTADPFNLSDASKRVDQASSKIL